MPLRCGYSERILGERNRALCSTYNCYFQCGLSDIYMHIYRTHISVCIYVCQVKWISPRLLGFSFHYCSDFNLHFCYQDCYRLHIRWRGRSLNVDFEARLFVHVLGEMNDKMCISQFFAPRRMTNSCQQKEAKLLLTFLFFWCLLLREPLLSCGHDSLISSVS